jgi:hypothetical protein
MQWTEGRKWGKKRDRNRRKEGLEPGGEEKLKDRVKRAGVVEKRD